MGKQLSIGAVAKLLGVTTKTIRHYHRVGLLAEPQRTGNGYRCYSAADVLQLQRIKRLQALGLSLNRIKAILGAPNHEHSLREVLEGLLGEVESQITSLEQCRDRIMRLLAESPLDALDQPFEPSPTMQLFEEHLGSQAAAASDELRKLDTRLMAQLDALLTMTATETRCANWPNLPPPIPRIISN